MDLIDKHVFYFMEIVTKSENGNFTLQTEMSDVTCDVTRHLLNEIYP